jgi:hypothetical protein
MDVDNALRRYGRLVTYTARRCQRVVPSIDVDDVNQTGMLFLIEIWSRAGMTDEQKSKLFRRDLSNHLHNYIRDELRSRNPISTSVTTIDLDALIARADCSVLSAVYEREFKREIYRLFSGVDRVILDCLIGSRRVKMGVVSDRDSGGGGNPAYVQWLSDLSTNLGIERAELGRKIWNIRRIIRETLAA